MIPACDRRSDGRTESIMDNTALHAIPNTIQAAHGREA